MSAETRDRIASCSEEEGTEKETDVERDRSESPKRSPTPEENHKADSPQQASGSQVEDGESNESDDKIADDCSDPLKLIESEDIKTESSSSPEGNSTENTNQYNDHLSEQALAGLNLLQKCLLVNFQLNLAASAGYEDGNNSAKAPATDGPPERPPSPTSSKRNLRERKKRCLYDRDVRLPKEHKIKVKSLIHSSVRQFKCSECDREFKNSGDLRSHSVRHSTARPYKCEDCDSTFKSKSTLVSHMAIHATVKPFPCDKCGEMFASKEKIKQHALCHLIEKAFKCCECGVDFKRKGDLKRHQDVHSAVRMFPCPDCGASFKRKGSLKKHSLNHLDETTMKLLDEELEYHLS